MKLVIFPIAPELEGLPDVDAELASIATAHVIVPDPPLIGYVTAQDVAHEAARNPCDVIIWMCHGDDTGLTLSNNEQIDSDLVIQFVRTSKASLCVFNACWSERLARRVFVACQIDVIYARRAVPDRDAALYMTALSDALANSDTYADAYRQAGSQGGTYKHLSRNDDMSNLPGGISALLDKLAQEVYALKSTLTAEVKILEQRNVATDRLIEKLSTNSETTQKLVNALEIHVEEIRKQFDALRVYAPMSQQQGQRQLIAMYLLVIIVAAGVYLLSRGGA